MKEALKMNGNDFNFMTTYWTIGYILGQIPSQIMMTFVRPSIWLPTCEFVWGILVMALAACKNTQTLFALRFFIGLFEASAFVGILSLLGNWYTPAEFGKRTCIFTASASVANMFSGYLQAGLYANMNGVHGLAGWQWLFIFDGIIGLPIAFYGYWAVPDAPTTTRARWLKDADRALAVR